ncbi:hypothetical protein CZ771_13430 [Actinomycetales bacterium JB111]|nr:hypothetical protein CZ771_13430 [Actinomycetales bacterium JB111]
MMSVTDLHDSPAHEWAVLFDLGGTLTTNGPIPAIAARLLGLPTSGEPLENVVAAIAAHREEYGRVHDDAAYWRAVAKDAGAGDIDPDVIAQLVAADVENWINLPSAVLTLVRDLRENHVEMGVLSNAPRSLARCFDNQPWASAFTVQRFSCYTGLTKPSVEAYEDAISHFDHFADRILYLDDRPSNVDAGAAAGLDAHLWTSPDEARALLTERGLLPAG